MSTIMSSTMSSTISNPSLRSIGSKIKWVLNQDTYRIAIMTKNGLLQVKSVTEGKADYIRTSLLKNGQYPLKKILFKTETAWRASLPKSGVVEIAPPKTRAVTPPTAYATPEELRAIEEKWKKEMRDVYERAVENQRRSKALYEASLRRKAKV